MAPEGTCVDQLSITEPPHNNQLVCHNGWRCPFRKTWRRNHFVLFEANFTVIPKACAPLARLGIDCDQTRIICWKNDSFQVVLRSRLSITCDRLGLRSR